MSCGGLSCSYGGLQDGEPQVDPLFLRLTVQEVEQAGAAGRQVRAGAGAEGDQLAADWGVPASTEWTENHSLRSSIRQHNKLIFYEVDIHLILHMKYFYGLYTTLDIQ